MALAMPVIKSAIKKMRQAERHWEHNRDIRRGAKDLLDSFKRKPTVAGFSKLVSALDKAAKTNIIHKNKAARLKSRLSKLIAGQKAVVKAVKKPALKKTSRKAPKKKA